MTYNRGMICSRCRHDKPTTEFHRQRDGYFRWCKACRAAYDRAYHKKTWESGVRPAQVAKRRQRNREFIWEYLSDKACMDCGETDIVILEFDHQRNKEYNISEMSGKTSSLAKILEEMKKCEIVCANCHRRRTAKQLNWYIIRA